MEQLNYNLLYRWFVGLGVDEAVWVATLFTKNRDRLLEADVAPKFLCGLLNHERIRKLLSDEHFSVDGTLVQAWASMKSFRAKDGSDEPRGPGRNCERSVHREKRSNETHVSTTDPQAQLHRKGAGNEAKLASLGHALIENRNGLIVDADLAQANGLAERQAAQRMIARHAPDARRLTLGADKAYNTRDFAADLRQLNVTTHVAQNETNRRSAIDRRTTRHGGYAVSQQKRKRIEESFGWGKTKGGLARPMFRGVDRLLQVHADHGELQPDPHTKAARGGNLTVGKLQCLLTPDCSCHIERALSLLPSSPQTAAGKKTGHPPPRFSAAC